MAKTPAMHSKYITKYLKSATKAQLMDGVAGYNQGYDLGVHNPTAYRVIPPDILAKVHALQVDMHRTHEQKTRLLTAGWEKGSVPTDITSKMDRGKHLKNRKVGPSGKLVPFPGQRGRAEAVARDSRAKALGLLGKPPRRKM
jgi:hypothetical protein